MEKISGRRKSCQSRVCLLTILPTTTTTSSYLEEAQTDGSSGRETLVIKQKILPPPLCMASGQSAVGHNTKAPFLDFSLSDIFNFVLILAAAVPDPFE